MTTLLRASVLALFGLAVATPVALAEKAPVHGQMSVDDQAGLFSADGIKQATQTFDGVTFKANTHFTVVTRKGAPEAKKKDLEATKGDKAKAGQFFGEWAREIYKEKHATGVLTLIYVDGDKFFVKTVADKQSDVYRHFGDKADTALEEKFVATIREAKSKTGAEATTIRDSGLMAGATYVVDHLKDTTVPDAKHKVSTTTTGEKKGMGIGGWICLGLCVALGIWVVVALIRALTGGGGGGGYGGGYGGGMGGGGGGFFTSFLGGMFGAAAGMWMYNNMFGGSHMSDMSAGESYGGDGGTADTGEGNVDTGSEGAGGGDWGDSGGDTGGGGDWGDSGGGGGDWGGGDTGGGGDFGGGGDW